MVKAKKVFPMLKYVMKRGVLIRTKSFSLEAKMMKIKKDKKNTGNSVDA